MFLTVYLSNNESQLTEVPVTPETLCRDVVDLCKEPGETHCYLAEVWRGSERVLSDGERVVDVLQRWGQQRADVRFFLRHDCAPGTDSGETLSRCQAVKRSGMKNGADRWMENGVAPPAAPPATNASLSELQEMASRQQQQIDAQQQLLASKEQRLRVLKQQQGEQERLRQLRENAENQESKLRRVRALRGQVEHKRLGNGKLVEEIEQMTAVFQQKQRELVSAVSRVEELSRQLEVLRGGKGDAPREQGQSSQGGDLERLYRELQLRNRLNQEQTVRLQQQRDTLNKRNLEAAAMDKRIAELRERLWKKKAALQQKENLPVSRRHGNSPAQHAGSRVAAVGPYIQQSSPGPPVPPRQEVILKAPHPDGTATLPLPNGPVKNQPRAPAKPHPGTGRTLPRPHPHTNPRPRPQADSLTIIPSVVVHWRIFYHSAVYGKPVLPSQQPLAMDHPAAAETEVDHGATATPATPAESQEADRVPRPLSPTKLLPFLSQPFRHQSDLELEALRRRLHHAPRPLKKRSSITEPEGPAGPNIQKLLYQKTTLAAMETPGEQSPAGGGGAAEDVERSLVRASPVIPEREEEDEDEDEGLPPPPLPPRSPGVDDASLAQLPLPPPPPEQEDHESDPCAPEYPPYPPPPYPSAPPEDSRMEPPLVMGDVSLPPGKRTNLRKSGSERISHGMRVRFNPLALLLDASLEGEYDLVQRIIYEVEDPSLPNDEGITALHNAVCAGHTEIVKFLVQYGVNVNAADSDGWTPLHCAASCNNVQACKFLVESGAAVFATTYSDMQTAADKCEEMEEGYAQCSQFLYGVQEKMGVMNRGVVYALWDYAAEDGDELAFWEGDCMTVLQRDDQDEAGWWWARCGDHEGYIPRNLLGLYLRIKPRQRTLA
uniref:Tumor protein p53 binding protein, 2b n=1 Tax=Denticeps clupeoides TaxID=299321 RepID=A0AAY4A1H7_9TELE